MSAPFRIGGWEGMSRPATSGPDEICSCRRINGDGFRSYLERLMKMIPAEVIGLYLVGIGIIPDDQPVAMVFWAVVCLAGVVAIRALGTSDRAQNLPVDWIHVIISTVAFVIWVYTLGGPFAYYKVHIPYVGSLLVLAWTFFVPMFYRGPTA
jgi:hypothetical protein